MIVVGSTIAPWKCDGRQEVAWLDTAEDLIADATIAGQSLQFFAALEVDGRGLDPYEKLLARLSDVWNLCEMGTFWKFAMDDGEQEVLSGNRLIRICIGRNMAHEYAMRYHATHLLLLDSDITPQGNCISQFLELDHPVVGGHVPIYALAGPPAPGYDQRVQQHWNTAGFLFLQREVFRTVSWHYDLDAGLTDDPCFQRETKKQFGETWVRHDVIGTHVPIPMIPVEDRDGDRKRYAW